MVEDRFDGLFIHLVFYIDSMSQEICILHFEIVRFIRFDFNIWDNFLKFLKIHKSCRIFIKEIESIIHFLEVLIFFRQEVEEN